VRTHILGKAAIKVWRGKKESRNKKVLDKSRKPRGKAGITKLVNFPVIGYKGV
jgi:hypothetical protein